jgi:hypothetical protein
MREHETQVAAAPAPAPPAPAAGPALGPVLEPQRVLAMQRTAGNRATTRYLLRSPTATATAALTATDFDGVMELPTARSNAPINARVEVIGGADVVMVESDFVDLKGEVTAKENDPANPGATVDPEVRVGFIQTLEQAGRIGHYTDDGLPTGKPYADVRPYVRPGTRDVQGQRAAPGAHATPKGTPPFYDFYSTISKRGEKRDLTSMDRLSHAFEVEIDGGKGKLASVGGTDKFRTSVAAHQPPSPPIHVDAAEWSQDWTIALDPTSHRGQGAAPSASTFKGALASLGNPQGAANWDKQIWKSLKDPAAIAQLSHGEMLLALEPAREQDRPVYEMMAKRLRDENPKLRFKLECVEDSSYTGDDEVTFAVEGLRGAKTRQATVGSGPFATKIAEFSFGILDFFDPNDVTTGMTLKVTATCKGSDPGEMTARHPWEWTHTIQVKSGGSKYNITMFAI